MNKYKSLTDEEILLMKTKHKQFFIDDDKNTFDYGCSCIGKKVKKKSNRPFKSTNKINTIKGVLRNNNTKLWAFSFVEDDSCVDIKQITVLDY